METKHTPGPWSVLPLSGKYYGTQVSLNGSGIVEVWTRIDGEPSASDRERERGWEPGDGFDHVESENSYANARLIAAAPELLEALREFVALHPDARPSELALKRAESAIAKATGGEA